MKAAVIFFLFLCFHLVGRNSYAHVNDHNMKTCYSPAQGIEKTQQVKNTNQDYFITNHTGSDEESTPLITVEEDNDEEENLIKKHISLVRYILAFSYTFIFDYCYSCYTDSLTLYTYPSCTGSPKYIVQRVLRI